MNSDHEFYKVQSVLAASGQLTDTELAELERHVDACSSCRQCLTDMAEIGRELFVAQARTSTNRRAPARMQDRFLARAAQSGIPVRRSASAMAGAPLVGAVATLLVVAALFGWRHPSAPATEREAGTASVVEQDKPIPALKVSASSVESLPVSELAHKVRFRQRAGAQRRAVSIPANNINNGLPFIASAQHNVWPDEIEARHLTALTYTPTRSFAKEDDVAAFFGRGDVSRLEQRTFHLDPKLASLSFLEFPPHRDMDLDTVRPTFVTPAFHLNSKRIW